VTALIVNLFAYTEVISILSVPDTFVDKFLHHVSCITALFIWLLPWNYVPGIAESEKN